MFKYINAVNLNILLIPNIFNLAILLNCQKDGAIGNYYLKFYENDRCYSLLHIIFIIIQFINLATISFYYYITTTLSQIYHFDMSNKFKIFDYSNKLLLYLYDLFFVFIYVFSVDKNMPFEYLFLLFIATIVIYYRLQNYPIYKNEMVLKMYTLAFGVLLMGSACLMFEHHFLIKKGLYFYATINIIFTIYVITKKCKFFILKDYQIDQLRSPYQILFYLDSFIMMINQCEYI